MIGTLCSYASRMRSPIFVVFGFVFLLCSASYSFAETKEFNDRLKQDSGPLCDDFKISKTLTIFCLENPNTKTLYKFNYSLEFQDKSSELKSKNLTLSVYSLEKKAFVQKMEAKLSVNGIARTASLDAPKLYSTNPTTWPIVSKDNHSDESFFLSMIILDFGDQEITPDNETPEGRFLLNTYHHLGMTPIADQKLLPTNWPPDTK